MRKYDRCLRCFHYVIVTITALYALFSVYPSLPDMARHSTTSVASYQRILAEKVPHLNVQAVISPHSGLYSLPCPLLWQEEPAPRPLKRLYVVSIGGVGTTPLMEALRASLRSINYDLNSIPDTDYLKHAPFGLTARMRLHRRQPAAILYVLGNPLAALESHFRRGWAGFQVIALGTVCLDAARSI